MCERTTVEDIMKAMADEVQRRESERRSMIAKEAWKKRKAKPRAATPVKGQSK